MSQLPLTLWKQNGPLPLVDRMLITQLRTQMSETDRDLTHMYVILLFTPEELEARDTSEGRKVIHDKLEAALTVEAARGKAGHWAYDAPRHERLVRLCDAFREMEEQEAA